jgi:hypothetical protein
MRMRGSRAVRSRRQTASALDVFHAQARKHEGGNGAVFRMAAHHAEQTKAVEGLHIEVGDE